MTAKKTPRTAKRDVMDRIHLEGVPAAFQAMLDVCRDPKAPAPARATCGSAIFRAAGLFDTKADSDPDKPLEEMTLEDVQAAMERVQNHIDTLKALQNGDSDMFG